MKKVIIITGASKGIGAVTAIEAAKQGYSVCVNYMSDVTAAESIVAAILNLGGKAIAVKADITQENEVIRMFETAQEKLGTITALVNNAGKLHPLMPLVDMSLERFKDTLDINVVGTFLCAREGIKRMSKTGGGAIVNISSGAVHLGSPNKYVDYAASKGAVDTLTVGLAKEVAQFNIRVNGIRPGLIETNIHQNLEDVKTAASQVPLGRIGQPKEIAESILWLLSEKSSYTTGAILDISGGK